MPKKVTQERERAAAKLRALIERDGRKIRVIGEAMGGITGGADAVQSLRKWLSGNAFGDKQRRQAAAFFGVPPDYFGLEGTSREDEADDDVEGGAVSVRWPSVQRWLDAHPDAGPEGKEAALRTDALLYSDMGDDVTGAIIEAAVRSKQQAHLTMALRAGTAKAPRQTRR